MLRYWFRPAPLDRPCALLLSLCSLVGGVALAWHHPLWPIQALVLFALWSLVVAWRPGLWLMVVPTCVGFLNFSPWTGWIVFDEYDLLLLATLSGGYARWALSPQAGPLAPAPRAMLLFTALLGGFGLWALFRGFEDAGGMAWDWFAGYTDAMNSVRVFKSLGFALLFVPLLEQELARSATQANQRLASGMAAGLAVVTLAVVWERAAFPGLLNFTSNYRTSALFWEMHVGGAALDGYLALSAPFAVWAVLSARRPVVWAGAAMLALLAAYAVLTGFARGVYFAIAAALLILGVLLQAQASSVSPQDLTASRWRACRAGDWRTKASLVLVLALVTEVVAVLGTGSFMSERLASTHRDLASRLEHWQRGLAMLDSPDDWWLGKGLGRLPSNYAKLGPRSEFPGSARLGEEQASGGTPPYFLTVLGPPTVKALGGQYAMTQHVSHVFKQQHQIHVDIRVQKATQVRIHLCERHLLYEGACQTASRWVAPNGSGWQSLVLPLQGPALNRGPWYAPRLAMLSLSVLNAGGAADFDNLRLLGPSHHNLLRNGNFSHGLAHWFPAAQSYFLPWHLDNLYLEIRVERGMVGLLLWLALLGYALWQLASKPARLRPLSPYLAASLCAALCVGLVSSLMDVPRIAFLFTFLTFFSIQTSAKEGRTPAATGQGLPAREKSQTARSPSAQT
ncbi:MAG: hypothetical protein A3F78_22425 [Burkholderiales bacterium RIFCSPLOWO2_12_FULL_61_40]|nr:MAG: hypothetical protein A3F78_22425 [Burkholderiales bacterium RIFCSPLOWO2_12_FULL_61_40]